MAAPSQEPPRERRDCPVKYMTLRRRFMAITITAVLGAIGSPAALAQATQPVWADWEDPELERLLSLASRSSPTLAQAAARLEEARAATAGAQANRWPELTANGGVQRTQRPESSALVSSTGSPRYFAQSNLDATLRWQIDLFGRKRAALASSAARQEAERLEFIRTRARLAAEIAQQYMMLRAGDQQQRVEEELAIVLNEIAGIDEALEQVGLQSAAETAPLKVEIANRQASLEEGLHNRALAMARLATLTGISPPLLDDIASRYRPAPQCASPEPIGIPISVVASRPEVMAAESLLRASQADRFVAERANWPTLTLSGTGGWAREGSGGGLIAGSNLASQLLGSLGLQLLDFGRARAEKDAAQARLDRAGATYAEAILLAAEDVDAAVADVSRASKSREQQRVAASTADHAMRIADARLESGLINRREDLAIRRSTLEERLRLIATVQQKCEADIRLSLATTSGGLRAVNQISSR